MHRNDVEQEGDGAVFRKDLSSFTIVKPDEIEKKSMAIIEKELGVALPDDTAPVIKRVIHTTADFSYADTLCFSDGVIQKAHEALLAGAVIVTDTNMAKAGINKKSLEAWGGECICYMAKEDVAKEAKARGVTRAMVSMERAAELGRQGKPVIFAIGNAPTALVQLYELIQEGKISPALVIAVPVGFVNVVEAKELIMQAGVPYIAARGRKGGSTVAAAICNALLYTLP